MMEKISCAQELNLSRTRMGTEAVIVLSHALATDNSTLKRIYLSGNELGESGGWHLMTAVTSSTYLQYVGLQGATFLPGPASFCAHPYISNIHPSIHLLAPIHTPPCAHPYTSFTPPIANWVLAEMFVSVCKVIIVVVLSNDSSPSSPPPPNHHHHQQHF